MTFKSAANTLGAKAGESEHFALPWLMLLPILLVQTTFQGGMQFTAPLAPFLQADLGISRAQVGLLSSAISGGSLAMVLASGWLADRFGAHLLLFAGPATIGLSLILASRAPSYWLMVVFVIPTGIGVALSAIAASKAVVGWFSAQTRGTAMGIKQTGTSLGVMIGAAVLPPIALAADWRLALGFGAAAVAASGFIALICYRDREASGATSPSQARGTLRALANRNIVLACAAGISFTAVQMSLTTYLVLYLTELRGMEVTSAGNLLALANLAGVTARILYGLLSDRLFGARRKGLLVFSGAASVVAALTTAFFGLTLSPPALLALILFFGLVGIGWTGMFMILLPELAGKDASGMGAAAALASCNLGYFVGPPLFGLIVDLSHSYSLAWLSLAAISAVATIAMVAVRETAPQPPQRIAREAAGSAHGRQDR